MNTQKQKTCSELYNLVLDVDCCSVVIKDNKATVSVDTWKKLVELADKAFRS